MLVNLLKMNNEQMERLQLDEGSGEDGGGVSSLQASSK